ncbi:MAG: nucleotide sugar dehydrogenase [Dehalococcoidia bacterium]
MKQLPNGLTTIAVVALGKIGLPVAAHYAALGHRVIGCDIDADLVAAINSGECPIVHEPGLGEMVAAGVRSGQLRATTDTAAGVAQAQVVIVLVPLDVDARHQPEFGPLDAAFAAIGAGLQAGALVLLETTVPTGTTRDRFGPAIEAGGLRCGRDFSLAFSPERVQSGRVLRDLATYPRVVGGVDPQSTERAAMFYEENFGVSAIRLSSAEAAEFCKIAESVYRDVNIALVNELARAARASGVDIHEVIPAANSQPQSHIHRPGLGVGGHCIPVYPYFLLAQTEDVSLPLAARAINDGMPVYAAGLLEQALGGLTGRRVLVLGLTYRPGVQETAHSPALTLAAELRRQGAVVAGHDPLLSPDAVGAFGLIPAAPDGAWPADAIVLHTADPAYRDLDAGAIPSVRVVLDCAGALDGRRSADRGITYLAIGRPVTRAAIEVRS